MRWALVRVIGRAIGCYIWCVRMSCPASREQCVCNVWLGASACVYNRPLCGIMENNRQEIVHQSGTSTPGDVGGVYTAQESRCTRTAYTERGADRARRYELSGTGRPCVSLYPVRSTLSPGGGPRRAVGTPGLTAVHDTLRTSPASITRRHTTQTRREATRNIDDTRSCTPAATPAFPAACRIADGA